MQNNTEWSIFRKSDKRPEYIPSSPQVIYKNEFVIDKSIEDSNLEDYSEIEKKIIQILDTKIRPAVARDGGDIKFKEFTNGKVKVELQGSCSGCPSSTMTLKKGVENLLCHYIPEVKEVLAV